MKKHIVSVITALALIITLFPASAFADEDGGYSDISGHWAEAAIVKWSGYGILQGSDGEFRPDDTVTRAELAQILYKMLQYPFRESYTFADVSESDWFYKSVVTMSADGVVLSDGDKIRPNESLTRQEAVFMIAAAFGVNSNTYNLKATSFTDVSSFDNRFSGYILHMEGLGFVHGQSDGLFEPNNTITRAQVVTIINNMVDVYITEAGEYSLSAGTNALITCAGVSIDYSRTGTLCTSELFIMPGAESSGVSAYCDQYYNAQAYVVTGSAMKVTGTGKCVANQSGRVNLDHIPIDLGFQSGHGSIYDPYCIATAQQLDNVRKYCVVYLGSSGNFFKLTSDIVISGSWTPLGSSNGNISAFPCKFDGGGHTVTYAIASNNCTETCLGLFADVTGSVKNLNVKSNITVKYNLISSDEACCVGGITGLLTGKLENCSCDANISVSSATDSVEIDAGAVSGRSFGIITDSSAEGVVSVKIPQSKTYCPSVGGITGILDNTMITSDDPKNGVISGCFSSADVSVEGGYMAYAGGIVGNLTATDSSSTGYCKLSDCGGIGNVSTGGSRSYNSAGGLIGQAANGTFNNCWASATVKVSGSPIYYNVVGGLAGMADSSKFTDCWASSDKLSVEGVNCILAGFSGFLSGTLKNCYVIGTESIGPNNKLVNKNSNTGTLTACYDLTGLTADKKTAIYAECGWDFDETWDKDKAAYPVLRGVYETEQITAMA